jgi:hypothetical protein
VCASCGTVDVPEPAVPVRHVEGQAEGEVGEHHGGAVSSGRACLGGVDRHARETPAAGREQAGVVPGAAPAVEGAAGAATSLAQQVQQSAITTNVITQSYHIRACLLASGLARRPGAGHAGRYRWRRRGEIHAPDRRPSLAGCARRARFGWAVSARRSEAPPAPRSGT